MPIALDDLDIRSLKNLASGRITGFNVLHHSQLLEGLAGFDISADEVEAAIAKAQDQKAREAAKKREKRAKKQSGGFPGPGI